ncbi:MAG: ABC transporter ATP-binding protein [Desulfobacterales bacterium]|nr:ABC transporter ATP-binding protein [Desulfobacterales bacterium]
MLLCVNQIYSYYGQSEILHGVSIQIQEGELVCVLGANGAGKTTLLKSIIGLVRPKTGTVEFQGARIDNLNPDRIIKKGITLCPEDKKLFPRMSVQKNLELGAWLHKGNRQIIERNLENVFTHFPILKERAKQDAGTLSGGEQEMLVIGRSLMSNPNLLILDEPSLGIAPLVADRIFEVVYNINKAGTTVVLVEQNASASLSIAGRGYVMETGDIILQGSAADLLADEKVKKAYLGI